MALQNLSGCKDLTECLALFPMRILTLELKSYKILESDVETLVTIIQRTKNISFVDVGVCCQELKNSVSSMGLSGQLGKIIME